MKNKINLKLVILFLSLIGFTLNPFILNCNISTENRTKQENLLKLSDSGIHIYSPENITYREGMEYYPATYGFIDDPVGAVPVGWQDSSSPGYYFRIISDKFGHKKVLRGSDTGSGVARVTHSFNNKQGSIEFWWAVDSVSSTHGYNVLIRNSTNASLFGLWVQGGQISIYTMTGWEEVPGLKMETNVWDHVRLDFRSATGSMYEGLNYNEFRLYYNGIEKGTYFFNVTGDPDFLMLYSGIANAGGAYFDAFGFSWDPNYNVGDNLKEGLLLSYSNDSIMEWVGYSLDQQTNVTLTGNCTLAMPTDGVHSIQIYGNNSVGEIFYSSPRYFTIDTTPYIEITSPEPKLYKEPISGNYLATYGFEDVPNDYLPQDWSDYSGDHPIDTRVISEFNGHKKVVRGYDGGTGAFNLQTTIKKTYGTVEWWWAISNAGSRSIQMCFFDSDGQIISGVMMENSNLRFWNSTDWITYVSTPTSSNTWYHCRIDFEQTSGGYMGLQQGTYKCYFNETDYGTYVADNLNELYLLRFYSGYDESNVYGYLDAVGYSWDPYYNVGDNLNEGFYLGFKTNTEFNWIGYSIDDQDNRTISRSCVIPMIPDGMHIIQIFGKDILDQTFSSDIRFFAIKYYPIFFRLNVEIAAQSFSTEEFNLTFYIYNEFENGIDTAEIDIWWNSIDVSSAIQSLGGGFYFISLAPITVAPGEAPIPLEMVISAEGYLDTYFEITIAVDPKTLKKVSTKPSVRLPLELILAVTFSSIAVVAVITTIVIKKKRD